MVAHSRHQMMNPNDPRLQSARAVAYGETILTLLPFAVLAYLIMIGYKDWLSIFYTSDWSLASSILAGQTMIRFTTGWIKFKGPKNWQVISLQTTFLFFTASFCLITYGAYNSDEQPRFAVAIAQIILFIISLRNFIYYGSAGQALLDWRETDE